MFRQRRAANSHRETIRKCHSTRISSSRVRTRTAAQVEALTETFTNIITEQGGQVTKKEYWGLRSLAYRIKKNRKGHYTLLNIDAPPAAGDGDGAQHAH